MGKGAQIEAQKEEAVLMGAYRRGGSDVITAAGAKIEMHVEKGSIIIKRTQSGPLDGALLYNSKAKKWHTADKKRLDNSPVDHWQRVTAMNPQKLSAQSVKCTQLYADTAPSHQASTTTSALALVSAPHHADIHHRLLLRPLGMV